MHSVRAGFRAVLRQPAVIVAEIAWRWAFGLAAWVLIVLSVRRVLAGINVSEAEHYLARRENLFLIADAVARVLYQALPPLARIATVLVPALAALWILAATAGRAATLRALLSTNVILSEGCRPSEGPLPDQQSAVCNLQSAMAKPRWASLTALHFFRAVFTFASVIALFGATVFAGAVFPLQADDPVPAILLWFLILPLVGFCWSIVNWFLSLAPIYIVRDGRSVFSSISDSLALFRRVPGPYVSAALWYAFLRAMALIVAFLAGLMIAASHGPRATLVLSAILALAYFALADFLYIARLAAFVALDESSQPLALGLHPVAPAPEPLSRSETQGMSP